MAFIGTLRITDLPPVLYSRTVEEDRGYVTPCWVWTGKPNDGGYGRARYAGRAWRVHRLARVLLGFPCPDDKTLDHLCRVRLCIRPDHTEPTTIGENVLRGEGSSARRARQTRCQRGHRFTAKNTYRTKEGYRKCRACDREKKRGLHR